MTLTLSTKIAYTILLGFIGYGIIIGLITYPERKAGELELRNNITLCYEVCLEEGYGYSYYKMVNETFYCFCDSSIIMKVVS